MANKKDVYVPTVGEEIANTVTHGVMSLVASGLPKALWNRAGALPSRGVMVSR